MPGFFGCAIILLLADAGIRRRQTLSQVVGSADLFLIAASLAFEI